MFTAHRHVTAENAGKTRALQALFPAFRSALGGLESLTRREILAGQELAHWRKMPAGSLPFDHDLSARQMLSVQNMIYTAVSGWQESVTGRVREFITGSDLPQERKTVLYRLNARRAWWAESVVLPWVRDPAGALVPCSEKQAGKDPAAVRLPAADEDLFLLRRLAKQAQKACGYPDLRRVNTLVLDSPVAAVTPAAAAAQDGTVAWWVKITTLSRGNPVQVPLAVNPYFERRRREALAAGGRMAGAVQLHLVRDVHGNPDGVAVSLLLQTPDAPARTEGDWLGLDFGFGAALLATSEGQLLGQAMVTRLKELDQILAPYAADLQRRGISLKTDPYYRTLQARISGYVTNEIGRLLNQLAARHGDQLLMGLAAEKLDFRGGGLSPQMNRIATRTGRKVLKARMAALTAKHGIAVTEVPSPWTSCECSGCGYTRKSNRRGRRFKCGFCGLKLQADVNAARVILRRRSARTPDHTGPRSRGNTFRLLDRRHRQRWGLPAPGTVPGVAGAPGQAA